jgi:hypothetical protein
MQHTPPSPAGPSNREAERELEELALGELWMLDDTEEWFDEGGELAGCAMA